MSAEIVGELNPSYSVPDFDFCPATQDQLVHRPKYSSLSTELTERELGLHFQTVRAALDGYIEDHFSEI